MTILVDEARWAWRGRRWAHLVSDTSYEELHAFAAALGMPRRAFQGDHYDVPSELRDRALARGAHPTDSRELVRRLRAAGLRARPTRRPSANPTVGQPERLPTERLPGRPLPSSPLPSSPHRSAPAGGAPPPRAG